MITRYAPRLRAVVACLCGLLGLCTTSAGALPAAIAVVSVSAIVLPATHVFLRGRWPWGGLLANDAVISVVGLSQLALGPRPPSAWIFAIVSIMSVTCHFEWPDHPWAAGGIALLGVLGYCGGSQLAGGGPAVADGIRLVVLASLVRLGLSFARRAARISDEAIERAARHQVEVSVAQARRSAGRAYLAMLHDTASTTLLMVSRNATEEVGWLRDQARRDLDRLATAVPPPSTEVDLDRLLDSLTGYRNLQVELDLPASLRLPAAPGLAIYHGVREALENVRRHSGDTRPRLSAWRDGDIVTVRLRDRGCGFRPDDVPPHRRGLSLSVRGRMAAAGGRAGIRTSPGRGTTVEWTWPVDRAD